MILADLSPRFVLFLCLLWFQNKSVFFPGVHGGDGVVAVAVDVDDGWVGVFGAGC